QTPELTDSVPEVSVQLRPLGEAIDTALSNRTELSVYDIQLSEQARKLAMRDDKLRPSLDVVAGFNSISPDTGLISRSLYDLGSFISGIEYRLPIDRRAALEDREITERELDVMHRMRVYQMERIAQEVRNAYRSFEASKSSVDILGRNLETAKKNLESAQTMVDEGLDDNRNLLEAQRSLTETETGLLSAKVELYLAGINLKYAMGEDITVIGTK
ncbi:MAG: TolC family protein, partial [Armatimonadetes bacterium]|nr:TolC family protein [Armatimonadota bacterium]